MARNKVLIGGDESEYVARADIAERVRSEAQAELMFIRERIRMFFYAVTQVRFPENPPSWAEDWPEWLETGEAVGSTVAEIPEL